MGETKIEWTDATWNPIRGCSRVSEGCRHCYAESVAARFSGEGLAYEGLAKRVRVSRPVLGSARASFDPTGDLPRDKHGEIVKPPVGERVTMEARWTGEVRLVEKHLTDPLRWRAPRRIFVNSMSDLFHEKVPDEWIDSIFAVMLLAHWHTFQVLTKRPERMAEYMRGAAHRLAERPASYVPRWMRGRRLQFQQGWPPSNVWLGVSVENQVTANERIPILLDTPAEVRFISAEPLLGPVEFERWTGDESYEDWLRGVEVFTPQHVAVKPRPLPSRLDWVIVGGESGPGAREFHVDWARSIVRQCRAAGVAVFVKQLGARVRDRNDVGFDGDEPGEWPEGTETGASASYQGADLPVFLRSRKGGDIDEWPSDLRVREFPQEAVGR